MLKYIFLFIIIFLQPSFLEAESIQQIKIVHINRVVERAPTIYSINPEIINNGILGSRMVLRIITLLVSLLIKNLN